MLSNEVGKATTVERDGRESSRLHLIINASGGAGGQMQIARAMNRAGAQLEKFTRKKSVRSAVSRRRRQRGRVREVGAAPLPESIRDDGQGAVGPPPQVSPVAGLKRRVAARR